MSKVSMFCLTGVESTISHELPSPIDVSSGEWEMGLIELTTYNSIPNIETGKNDKLYYGDGKVISVPEGSYEIEDLEKNIISQLPKTVKFSLKPNNNTLKSELFCSEKIDFSKKDSLAQTLGFKNQIYIANETHVSQLPVDIIKVNSIRIDCNVTRGSYINGIEGHTIHEFFPVEPPGYKIVELPRNVIYLPVIGQRINNLTVTLKDQDGNLVNFRGERISVRLHLRRRNGSSV